MNDQQAKVMDAMLADMEKAVIEGMYESICTLFKLLWNMTDVAIEDDVWDVFVKVGFLYYTEEEDEDGEYGFYLTEKGAAIL